MFEHKNVTIPMYVTRKTANGETGSWTVGVYAGIVILIFIQINLILWGLLGTIFAIKEFIGLF